MIRSRVVRVVAVAAALSFLGMGGSTASAETIVSFDFENAAVDDPTAAASATGPGISGAVFDGTKDDSRVILAASENRFTSSALDPATNGGYFVFFTLDTSTTYLLDTMSFAAGQNDTDSNPADFDVLLSPVDDSAPATGDRKNSLSGYSLLDTISVPNGFAGGSPNISVDLTGTTLTPGTYHIALAVNSGIGVSTTQLFVDDLTLTAVPEPGTAVLLATGLAGLGLYRRRLR